MILNNSTAAIILHKRTFGLLSPDAHFAAQAHKEFKTHTSVLTIVELHENKKSKRAYELNKA
jgi:hypothetical protein